MWITKQFKSFHKRLQSSSKQGPFHVDTHLSQRLESGDWLSLCRISTMPMSRNLSWRSWEPKRLKLPGYWERDADKLLSFSLTGVLHSSPFSPLAHHPPPMQLDPLHAWTLSLTGLCTSRPSFLKPTPGSAAGLISPQPIKIKVRFFQYGSRPSVIGPSSVASSRTFPQHRGGQSRPTIKRSCLPLFLSSSALLLPPCTSCLLVCTTDSSSFIPVGSTFQLDQDLEAWLCLPGIQVV